MFAAGQGEFGRALLEADRSKADLPAIAGRARIDVDHFVGVVAAGTSIEVARALVAVATGEGREVLDRDQAAGGRCRVMTGAVVSNRQKAARRSSWLRV
jgi:hypothetical protein